jgi:hypothetical protein
VKVVYPTANAVVAMPGGEQIHVPYGTHWSAKDPVVLAHPDLFSDDPRHGLYGQPPDGADAPVEQATAAPGEKRQVRRG